MDRLTPYQKALLAEIAALPDLGLPFRVGPNRRRDRLAIEEDSRRRANRRKARDEERERDLRAKIAEGADDRADKYLHAAARRRRNEAKENDR